MEVPPHVRAAARRALSLPGPGLAAECDEEFFVAGGPGGQHRNKTATERRSQAQNRAAALARLRERLQALAHVPARRVATRPTRGAKERRLAEKRLRGERKAGRRDWE
jgi:protein subunit release factor B